MEDQAQDQFERILARVHSLDDLSADVVVELRRISEGSLVLDKFKVPTAEYWNWLDKVGDDIRGVEYDAQNARIALKGGPGWMHEAASQLINSRLLRELEDRLSAATGSRYFLTGSTCCSLAGDFDGSTKQADASLMEYGAEWPAVILEVGISETTNKLYKDAERWLEGSLGQTKLVILVDVEETDKQHTLNDKWELSAADFQQMRHRALSRDILQWYHTKAISLVGTFKLSVHLWYSDGDRQCILNKAVFSPGNLIDLTTINDVPLRLEHLMPAGSDLDMSQHF
ncbi:hypothetical protein TSTA_041500 [Paecilomyces variotii No. 5]|uniref:Uncharacterized protein n=1 Tax=Byssochlamys spectabilis (strain No. 5 / NBRC 109023) TaxID=1356009 RepID=V5FYK1_BYSSN|nr:hypothetical protein TSTA_041500 [Paecilomyces variotii No. 5]